MKSEASFMKTPEDVAREYLIDLLLKENRHTQSSIFCNYDRIENEAYCTVEAEKDLNDYAVTQITEAYDRITDNGVEFAVHIIKIFLNDRVVYNVTLYPKEVKKSE